VEGPLLGEVQGWRVGEKLGVFEGVVEGQVVGKTLGVPLGVVVGVVLGLALGITLGALDVGNFVGAFDVTLHAHDSATKSSYRPRLCTSYPHDEII